MSMQTLPTSIQRSIAVDALCSGIDHFFMKKKGNKIEREIRKGIKIKKKKRRRKGEKQMDERIFIYDEQQRD